MSRKASPVGLISLAESRLVLRAHTAFALGDSKGSTVLAVRAVVTEAIQIGVVRLGSAARGESVVSRWCIPVSHYILIL